MRLYDRKTVLTEEEAGGHGEKWGVLSKDKDTERFLLEKVPYILKYAKVLDVSSEGNVATEKNGILLRYEEKSGCGIVAVVARLGKENLLVSLYPECKGRVYEIYPEAIELFPNGYEARIEATVADLEMVITFFDTRFLNRATTYKEGVACKVRLAALAYRLEPSASEPIVIDDPEEIEKFRAREYWIEKYGIWEEKDEMRALELYRKEVEVSTEPVVIETDRMTMWMEDDIFKDDVHFQGRIEKVEPNEMGLLGTRFRCYHIAIDTGAEEAFVLPFYTVAEGKTFACGDYVRGVAWVHGYIEG